MSIAVPLYGFGSGGSSLYYSVVCSTTEPAKKEGRIWVKSATPMAQFEVGKTWTTAKVGVVVVGGTPGGANPTSANKILDLINTKVAGIQNRLKLTPASCKQVQGSVGNWVSVDAYVCHSDTWIQFSSVFSATINITYPAGSTCTCINGSTTLTAPNTSGTWACTVPNAGTWTVSCTDGTKSKSVDVEITADGQSKSVHLKYVLHLYNNGDQCSTITGGWTAKNYGSGGGSASLQDAEISATATISGNNLRRVGYITSQKVDLTKYTKIYYSGYAKNAGDDETHDYGAFLEVFRTNTYSDDSEKVALMEVKSAGNYGEYLDVSALSGSFYIYVGAFAWQTVSSGSVSASMNCKEVFLE